MTREVTQTPPNPSWRDHARVMGRLWLGFSLLAALIAVPYVLVTGVLMGLGYLPDWNLGRTVKPAIAVMVVPAVFVLLYPVFLLDTGNRNAGNSA